MPLPRIGTATANLARTVTAPAVAPISQAVGVLRNPIQAMDLPPAIGVAGKFARDVTGGGMPSFARAFEGVMRKSENKLDSVAQNTQSTAAGVVGVLGSTASMETYLQAGFESMVELLGEIERNTRGPSEEEIMESKRDKNAAQAKGAGAKVAEPEAEGLFDFSLGEVISGLLTFSLGGKIVGLITTLVGSIVSLAWKAMKFVFNPKKLLSSVFDLLKPSNLSKVVGKLARPFMGNVGQIIFTGIRQFIKSFIIVPVAIYQFLEGFLREMFADSDDGFWTKVFKGISSGLIEIFDTFTLGIMGDENKQKLIAFGHKLVDGFMEWWQNFDFMEFWDSLPSFDEMVTSLNNFLGGEELLAKFDTWLRGKLDQMMKDLESYFTEGEGVGIAKAIKFMADGIAGLWEGAVNSLFGKIAGIGRTIQEFAVGMESGITTDWLKDALFNLGGRIIEKADNWKSTMLGTDVEPVFGDQFPAGIEAARGMGVDFAAPGSPQADPSQAVLDAIMAGLASSGGNNQVNNIKNGDTYVERMNPWIGQTSWEGGGRF